MPILSVFITRPSTCAGATNDRLFTRRSRSSMLRRVTALGHEDAFPRPKAERPLSVQSTDLRGAAKQRARCADSRPSLLTRNGDVRPILRPSSPRQRLVVSLKKRSFAADFWSCWQTSSRQFV